MITLFDPGREESRPYQVNAAIPVGLILGGSDGWEIKYASKVNDIMEKKVREIINDWKAKFPILRNFTPSILLLRADPFLIGLKFEVSGLPWDKNYWIYFSLYPLWTEDNLRELRPLLCRMVLRERVNLHDYYFDRNCEKVIPAIKPLLQKPIPIDKCVNFCSDRQFYRSQRYNPFFMQVIYEVRLGIAMYLDDQERLSIVKKEIEKDSRRWKEETFVNVFGCSIEDWITDLFERFSDRERFMENIRINAERPKVARLNSAQISLDKYEPDFRPWLLRKLFPRNRGR